MRHTTDKILEKLTIDDYNWLLNNSVEYTVTETMRIT